jgi:DNA-directed RNA polymerase sigma subunit (sigma70/sigma32)
LYKEYGMNHEDYAKEMQKVFQTSVENSMKMLSMMQDQNEKMLGLFLDQASEAQSEGRKMLNTWLEKGKEAQQAYRKMLDENLKKVFQAGGKK